MIYPFVQKQRQTGSMQRQIKGQVKDSFPFTRGFLWRDGPLLEAPSPSMHIHGKSKGKENTPFCPSACPHGGKDLSSKYGLFDY